MALSLAAPALGGSSSEQAQMRREAASMRQQVADLSAQVKTLQKQVKTLQKQVKNAQGEAAANYAGDACLTAMVTDALQGTWLVVDQIATDCTGEDVLQPADAPRRQGRLQGALGAAGTAGRRRGADRVDFRSVHQLVDRALTLSLWVGGGASRRPHSPHERR